MIITYGLMIFLIDLFIPIVFFSMLFYEDCITSIENRKERIKNKRKMKYDRMISLENDKILHNYLEEKYLITIIKEYANI